MGNRAALLDGAKRCITDKGIPTTTARDIANAAGVSLGAIGYHFGSKDVLLAEAAAQMAADQLLDLWWAAFSEAAAGGGRSRAEVFAAGLSGVVAGLDEQRSALLAGIEALSLAERSPETRERVQADQASDLAELAEGFGKTWPDLRGKERRALAALAYSTIHGVARMWLADPSSVPAGAQVAHALGALAAAPAPVTPTQPEPTPAPDEEPIAEPAPKAKKPKKARGKKGKK
ncbi:TetR/AcrR family transcriptional regulator [Actinomycetota bacterium]